MLTRSVPNAPPGAALTSLEVQILDRLMADKYKSKRGHETLGNYLTRIAKLGGYLARNRTHRPAIPSYGVAFHASPMSQLGITRY